MSLDRKPEQSLHLRPWELNRNASAWVSRRVWWRKGARSWEWVHFKWAAGVPVQLLWKTGYVILEVVLCHWVFDLPPACPDSLSQLLEDCRRKDKVCNEYRVLSSDKEQQVPSQGSSRPRINKLPPAEKVGFKEGSSHTRLRPADSQGSNPQRPILRAHFRTIAEGVWPHK